MTNTYISPSQCRMARAHLNWPQQELADRAGVVLRTISNFETGEKQTDSKTVSKIASVFELAGIEFLDGGGVQPSKDWIRVIEGDGANRQLLEDICLSMKETGGEVLIAGLTEVPPEDTEGRAFLEKHLARLEDLGISERILLRHGDTNLIAPRTWYRWHENNDLGDTPFQLYGNKIALIEWGPPERVVLIDHPKFAATFRNLFNTVWRTAQPVPVDADE